MLTLLDFDSLSLVESFFKRGDLVLYSSKLSLPEIMCKRWPCLIYDEKRFLLNEQEKSRELASKARVALLKQFYKENYGLGPDQRFTFSPPGDLDTLILHGVFRSGNWEIGKYFASTDFKTQDDILIPYFEQIKKLDSSAHEIFIPIRLAGSIKQLLIPPTYRTAVNVADTLNLREDP
jgi:hypothetical protein